MKGSIHPGLSFLGFVLYVLVACFSAKADEPALTLGVETDGARVTLSWNLLESAENYTVYYAPCPDYKSMPVASIIMGAKTSLSVDLWDGASYYAAVTAENKNGIIEFSNVVSFVCSKEPALQNALNPFGSDQALADYLKGGMSNLPDMEKVLPYMALDNDASEVAGPVVSGTNIQEQDVDEADTVKTDGRYLYAVPTPGCWTPENNNDGEKMDSEIGVYLLSSDPPAAERVSSIPLDDNQEELDGLYLLTGRPQGPDLLVTIGGKARGYWGSWGEPWYWMSGSTEVVLYDVSDPLNITQMDRLKLDGQLVSSRIAGDTLYLVTRFTPSPAGFKPYAANELEKEANSQVLEKAGLSDLTPGFFMNRQVRQDLVRADSCYLPPVNDDVPAQPTLITVTAVRLGEPGNPVSQTIAGPTETVYMSTDSLYLATTRYKYDRPVLFNGSSLMTADGPYSKAPVTTDIHKFTLTPDGPRYRGSGTVPGNLGMEEDKKPFRMSDYDGVLRIATSLGDTWDGSASTRLALLREENEGEASGGGLMEISHIEGIGEPGERLYAVRYAGSRAYLVTFRVTDPLYVIDLSDPEKPVISGELHIDGYSDYLHPVGENLLIGIGKDALPDETSNDFGGRGAWYQGVKLSLFDVSKPEAPVEIESLVFGKRGTGSDALYDHHALAYLPPVNGKPARLALPVKLHDRMPSGYDTGSEKPWTYYDWTHTGLYLFDIIADGGAAGIIRRGEIIAENWGNAREKYCSGTDRAVILNDGVHYIHRNSIMSEHWGRQD